MAFERIVFEGYEIAACGEYRKTVGMTQKELAAQSEIPLRTIQQYEQRQKDINKAGAEYLILLSKTLHCSPEELIEKV
jgi:transcriptional regulator with XRE-family HTH domain